MVPLPGDLLTRMPIDAEMVRRIYENNPFFRARANRYAQLDEAIRGIESTAEATTTANKYMIMLKKRRDDIVLELIDLVANATPATQEAIWRVPPTGVRSSSLPTARVARSWHWP